MAITTEQYQHHKDRLVELLEKACKLPGLLDQSAGQIENARRKLQEDQFEIVLVAEFAGGKSTTFNNLCDGREISPRGKIAGLKTSGCIIRAKNLSDPGKEEHALVRWRTPAELLMSFDNVLWRSQGSEDDGATPKDEDNWLERFDPSTKKGRSAIRAAAQAEIKIWESNKAGFDPDDLGLIDLVRFALIVAELYDHPKIKAARERDRFPLAEIHRLVAFPEEWQVRWEKWQASAFEPEELLFAFVAQVDCHLHSANLGRLGCAITDCPGLFASHWDTRVAREAILRADAVLYLIDGGKQLPQNGLKAIRSLGLGKGLIFVGANCKTQSWKNAERILAANKTLLQNQGLDIQPQNIRIYHPLLALHATQLERGVDNLETSTLDELRRDFQLEHPDPAQIKTRLERRIANFRLILDENDDGEGPSFGKSGMPELITAVESFVIQRKAGAILLGNGGKVKDALSETEASLKLIEDTAQKRFDISQREFDDAKNALDEFERKVQTKSEELGDDAPRDLAESFWRQIDDNKEEYINSAAKNIASKIIQLETRYVKSRQELHPEIEEVVRIEFDQWIVKETKNWIDGLSENPSYRRSIQKPLRNFESDLREYWKDLEEKNLPTLEGIAIPAIANSKFEVGIAFPNEFIVSITDLLSLSRFKVIFQLVFPIIDYIYTFFAGNRSDTLKGPLEKILTQQIKELESRIKPNVEEQAHAWVISIREYIDKEVVSHPRRIYARRRQDAEILYKEAKEDRIKLAKDAKRDREQHVAPLRERCEHYLGEVGPLFPEHD